MTPSKVAAVLWAGKTLETQSLYRTCDIKHIVVVFDTSAMPWYFMSCKTKD